MGLVLNWKYKKKGETNQNLRYDIFNVLFKCEIGLLCEVIMKYEIFALYISRFIIQHMLKLIRNDR